MNDLYAVNVVQDILLEAINLGASDIHCEPEETGLRIRFRIDGVLYDKMVIQLDYGLQVVSRIKVMAQVNVAEKRLPQDGKLSLQINSNIIDLRVSTFPTLLGEKVVIRILDRERNSISLESLGFESGMLEKFKKLSQSSNGFFLVTGPTGSGKTTTLYSVLSVLNSPEKNIITLEDPIEYKISGITQGQINADIGFTFERGIRALLRQDPDIIMVGEIRDRENAEVAIQASLTGHLVLSTLHTNDAISAVMRLIDMGIESFLVKAALTGVLAQRLARKLCQDCKYKTNLEEYEFSLLKKFNIILDGCYKSKGCSNCNGLGYKGRVGIFSLLEFSEKFRSLVNQNPQFELLYEQALKDGMKPLIYDAALKVSSGIISVSELIRTVL